MKKSYVFGSYARGYEKYSDIDVLIIYEDIEFDKIKSELEKINFGGLNQLRQGMVIMTQFQRHQSLQKPRFIWSWQKGT
ncbi:nucleotidyltransferase family protein [Shewanella waksmanii]|uniref:nucleotidyltransferase family protein n=1 Tax=Shewanella waksmanii TaxID=213783 RepID=UPI00373533B1